MTQNNQSNDQLMQEIGTVAAAQSYYSLNEGIPIGVADISEQEPLPTAQRKFYVKIGDEITCFVTQDMRGGYIVEVDQSNQNSVGTAAMRQAVLDTAFAYFDQAADETADITISEIDLDDEEAGWPDSWKEANSAWIVNAGTHICAVGMFIPDEVQPEDLASNFYRIIAEKVYYEVLPDE